MSQYDPKDLNERVNYEYAALEFVRHNLFAQSEGLDFTLEFKLKDYKSNPEKVRSTIILEPVVARFSQEAVNEALTKVAPLIFTSSFKVNDMIAEWILEELPNIQKIIKHGRHISFNQKVEHFTNGKLPSPLPLLFQEIPHLEKCFGNLYKEMEDFRHSITHRSDFVANKDGSLMFTPPKAPPNKLSRDELAAYVSFTCLLVKLLLNKVHRGEKAHLRNILNRDLHVLQKYHKEQLPQEQKSRLIAVRVIAHAKEQGPLPSPLNISIPIDFIETLLKNQSIKGLNNVYILFVVAEDKDTKLEWKIPQQSIKGDKLIILDKSDADWSKFLLK